MNRRDFLVDRLPYVLAFLASLGLALAVVRLELALSSGTPAGPSGPTPANLFYAGLLAAAVLLTYLFYDYQRQRPFWEQLAALRDNPFLDAFAALGPGATREQELAREAIRTQHRLYLDELSSYRAGQEWSSLFSSRWAHQMKTPLSVIDLTLREEEEFGRCPPEVLASLREETDKLDEGLELMLSNARLADFKADFVAHRVDIAAALRRVVNDHRAAFIRRKVYPSLQAPPEPLLVETDDKWARFVFGQLVANAIKYSRPGAGDDPKRVSLEVEPYPQGCRVRVVDQGVGIPEQDVARVFEPFFTGENGRLYPGATGMGLYLAREVCRRLGHQIDLTSKQGVGTTVTVTFQTKTSLHADLPNLTKP